MSKMSINYSNYKQLVPRTIAHFSSVIDYLLEYFTLYLTFSHFKDCYFVSTKFHIC